MASTEDRVHESIRILIEGESSRLNQYSRQSIVTIRMVPDTLRNLNPSAYTPQITSIGPLHKEEQRLRPMEEHKVRYMCQLFDRFDDSRNISHECVQAIVALVTQARACYVPSFTTYDDSKLAEMMVIDGCFILELLYKFKYEIVVGDPIFDNILVTHDIKSDLLLLENQIPFFILEKLFKLTVKHVLKHNLLYDSLTDLISYFFEDLNFISQSEFSQIDTDVEHCHILGVFHSCYRPAELIPSEAFPTRTYSATKLSVAGVRLVKADTTLANESLLAVKFTQSPERKLEIPVLCIKNSTPLLLRNLIAYEQCYPLSSHYITSFAFLMDRLIDTTDDVSMLVRSQVLYHNLGAGEEVKNLFNSICNGVVLRDFYYAKEWGELDAYCRQYWPRTKFSLIGLFESTTWKTWTVFVAGIVFVLTLLQTIYAIIDYY